VLDLAYNGLGKVAYQTKDYQKALRLFSEAVDKVGAQQKLKDVTVGRGKTLLAINRLDEAKKIFEQGASARVAQRCHGIRRRTTTAQIICLL